MTKVYPTVSVGPQPIAYRIADTDKICAASAPCTARGLASGVIHRPVTSPSVPEIARSTSSAQRGRSPTRPKCDAMPNATAVMMLGTTTIATLRTRR